MIKRAGALLLFIAALTGSTSWAATYYISTSGSDSNVCSTGSRCLTLNKLKSVSTCGDTWVVGNGTYTQSGNIWNPTNLPSCASWASSTTIQAENTFQAVFSTNTSGTSMLTLAGSGDSTETTYYMYVNGIVWDYQNNKTIDGYHIKMKNVEFIGGQTSGNIVNVQVGTNNFGASKYGGNDITIEDFLVLGRKVADGGSGRYGILAFNTNNTVFRRGIIHMNNGYTCGACGNPSADINIYNSPNTFGLNIVAMDEQQPPDFYQGGLYVTANNGTGAVSSSNQSGYYGSIGFNLNDYCSRIDGAMDISSFTYRNDVCVDNVQGGITMNSGTTKTTATVENVTVINSSVTAVANAFAQFGGGGAKIVRNVISYGVTPGMLNGLSSAQVTYDDCFNSGSCGGGTGQITTNPLTNGASTWLRIEAGSTLSTAGNTGGPLGATIKFKIGPDLAAYGDTNWDQETANLLWPWPNQTQWKTEMCRTYSTDFCGSTYTALNLTQYLNARGAFVPSAYLSVDVSSPGAPTNLSTTAVTTSSFNFSITASTDDVGVTDYRLDVSTDNFSTFSGGYNDTSMGTGTTGSATGLTASTTYSWRMRAKDAAGNTSNQSATASATTATPASVSMSRGMNLSGTATLNIGGGRLTVP